MLDVLICWQRKILSKYLKIVKANIILTPHPKEASKLLNITTKEVNSNRIKYIKLITKNKNSIIILKGLGSLILIIKQKNYF